MDYVFTRGENRQWYLTALRESDMRVESRRSRPTDAVVDNMQNEMERRMPRAPSPRRPRGAESPGCRNLDDTGDAPAEDAAAEGKP